MRDLEIRGAGNLLGTEQHGRMLMIGYELYCKLLEDAVRELSGSGAALHDSIETSIELPLRLISRVSISRMNWLSSNVQENCFYPR